MIVLTKIKKKTVRKIITIVILVALIVMTYLTGRYLPTGIADWYSLEVFPALSNIPQKISALTSVSFSEITVVVCGCLALPLLILWMVFLIKKAMTKGIGKFLYQSFRNALAVILVLLFFFEILHGLNYRRTPARLVMGLDSGNLTVEEYTGAFEWAYEGMIKARSELTEDENGVAKMSTGFAETAEYASKLVDSFCLEYGITPYRSFSRAKSVRLSHYWSWTYIVGMYNPIYGEANINTDIDDLTALPMTICHELCHSKGFANETDCNLLGALCCTTADRADFRYCGYYNIYVTLLGELTKWIKQGFKYDTHLGDVEIRPVIRDIMAASAYWKAIDKEVLEVQKLLGINITDQALAANNQFLESNGEKGGNETYNVPDNAYVHFYLKYVVSEGGKNA